MRGRTHVALALCLGASACGGASPRPAEPAGEEPLAEERPAEPVAEPEDPGLSEDPEPEAPPPTPEAEALADAFAERLTVSRRRDGTRVLTPRCRNGPVDCERRLLAFASLIVEIATAQDVDPLLLAAMALRESGLDPAALGRNREAGIVQLHPRGAGRDVRYVRDAGYRRRCQRRVDACQREVLERGVSTLVEGIERCGGLRGGLGAYASGHCTTRARYIGRILEERETLRGLVRGR